MQIKDVLIRVLKKFYRVFSRKKFAPIKCITDRGEANRIIYDLLMSPNPCMISRFGTTELITVNNYLCVKSSEPFISKVWKYISDETHTPWWFKDNFKYMWMYSGIFPATQEIAEKLAERYLEDTRLIDVLGSFQYYEKYMPLREDVQKVHLETLYPFFVDNPWTLALKGKKVLVVHPFDTTINYQATRKNKIFTDKNIWPDYELVTYKAVQSAAEIKVPFQDWFEALKYMENEIDKIDFDICLLGCGAYGLPLAAHIKRRGKKAVHLGGGIQLLFGIMGKRWDDIDYLKAYNIPEIAQKPYNSLYNNYWIKPLKEDTPKEALKVDGAVYW